MTLAKTGTKQEGVVKARTYEEDPVHPGNPYEIHLSCEPDRELSEDEAEEYVKGVTTLWVSKHPNHEVHYSSIRRMSESERASLNLSSPSYEVVIQVTPAEDERAELIVGTVGVLIGVALFAAAGAAAAIGFAGAAVAFIVAAVVYFEFVYEAGIRCPKCGATFANVTNFKNHLATKHPDNPEEMNEKLVSHAEEYQGMDWQQVALYGGVAFAGAYLLSNLIGGE